MILSQKVALRWTPTGKRNRGRPKTTWRRTITTELFDMGMTMGEALVKTVIGGEETLWPYVPYWDNNIYHKTYLCLTKIRLNVCKMRFCVLCSVVKNKTCINEQIFYAAYTIVN